MIFPIGRLMLVKYCMFIQKAFELQSNDLFNNFGTEMQIRDWSVVWYFLDVTAFKNWCNYPMFEGSGKDGIKERLIDNLSLIVVINLINRNFPFTFSNRVFSELLS